MTPYFHGFYFSDCQISLTFPEFIPIFQCQDFFQDLVKFPDLKMVSHFSSLPVPLGTMIIVIYYVSVYAYQ